MLSAFIIALIVCVSGTLWWRRRKRNRRLRLDDAAWVEVLSCLDRPALDCAERLARRFRRLVTIHFSDKCFRRLLNVELSRIYADFFIGFDEIEAPSWSSGNRCAWLQSRRFHDFNEAVDFLFFIMRGTAIGTLRLAEVTITKYFAEKLHEASSRISIR